MPSKVNHRPSPLEGESENEQLRSLAKTTEKRLKPVTGAGLNTFEVLNKYEVYRNKTGNKLATRNYRITRLQLFLIPLLSRSLIHR